MNQPASQLKRLLILFESEAECRERLAREGFSDSVGQEVASYLSQATDLQAFYDRIQAAFQAHNVTVDFFEVGQADRYLGLMQQESASCILWNVTDGFRFYRASFTTSTAALLGVKTFGSGPQAQHLCQDKYKTIALARSLGVRTPATILCRGRDLLSPAFFPETGQSLFVKPNTLGAKVGIFSDSKCTTFDQALELSKRIWQRYRDDAIVQPFIPGFDVRVSYMNAASDGQASRLGFFRLGGIEQSETRGEFMTMRDNWTLSASRPASEQHVPTAFSTPAAFNPTITNLARKATTDPHTGKLVAEIETIVEKMAHLMGLKDYYSFDFRISETGEVFLLEFEVCPAVTIYDFLTYLQELYGIDLPTALTRAVQKSYADSPS